MKRLFFITTVFALLFTSCGVSTNLDIQEEIFPPEQSIVVYQPATARGFKSGATIQLIGIGAAGKSNWEKIQIENLTGETITFTGIPETSNNSFELETRDMRMTLPAYERTVFDVRYELTDIGSIYTEIKIRYTIKGRKRVYHLKLTGNASGVQVLEIEEGKPEIILANGGAASDFGYSPYNDVEKTFRIKNNSKKRIEIQNTVLDADAVIAGFSIDGVVTGFIEPEQYLEFRVTLPENKMKEYKCGFIEIKHELSTEPYKVAICGGGKTMPLAIVRKENGKDIIDTVPYKLTKNCFDFEYKPETAEKRIWLKNIGNGILRFEKISYAVPAGNFEVTKKYEDNILVYPEGKAEVSIKFTPNADEWSETDIVIKNENTNREYTLSLTGSGFKQPNDLEGLAIWLRADRIGLEHIKEISAANKVQIIPDISGNNLHAYKYRGEGPTYSPGGVNNLPSMNFSAEEGMAVTTRGDTWITKNADGTTTFTVFKVSGGADKRLRNQTIISASTGENRILPALNTSSWSFDPVDGMHGNGANIGNPKTYRRFVIDVLGRHPAYSYQYDIPDGSVYSLALHFDNTTIAPEPNVRFFVNGTDSSIGETPISYVPSYDKGDTTANVRAYGYPIGDGRGNRRDYEIGASANLDPCKHDYTWSLIPRAPGVYGSSLYYNRVTAGTQYNGSIRNLFIGKNAAGEAPFYGEIAEIIIFQRALKDEEIKEVNKYIKTRYNIQPVDDLYTRKP